MMGKRWHRATGEAAKLAPLVAPFSRKNSVHLQLLPHLAPGAGLADPLGQGRKSQGPAKGKEAWASLFRKAPAYLPIEPLCAQPWTGVKERQIQDPGPVEPGALGRLEAWGRGKFSVYQVRQDL